MLSERDPARTNIRTMHASFVVMFLLMFVIFGLGAFETLAAIVNPSASLLLAVADARRGAPEPTGNGTLQDRPWITVNSPTQVFSARMDPLRTAQPGERYQITTTENGWALAVRQGDPPDRAIWIALDEHVGAPGSSNRAQEILIPMIVIAVVLLLAIGLYYGLSGRLRRRGSGRANRRRAVVSGVAGETVNGSGRVPTAP